MKQKLKTHKAMAKRLKITASGKFLRRKVAISHLRRHKSPESVRSADKYFQLSTADTARMHGVTYSKLMHAIHTANIGVDRKILAEMAVNDEAAFSALVKAALEAVS